MKDDHRDIMIKAMKSGHALYRNKDEIYAWCKALAVGTSAFGGAKLWQKFKRRDREE